MFELLTEDAGINYHVMVCTTDDERTILWYVFFADDMYLLEEPGQSQ
jgi:hypothetical protein